MEFLALVAAIIAIVLARGQRKRVRELEGLVGRLTARVWLLEHPETAPVQPPPEPAAPPIEEQSLPPQTLPPPPPPPLEPPSAPQPTLSEQLRNRLGNEEWEALVGGSLLNKLGGLVLVIGIALFLGYALSNMGPAGRIAVGAAVAVALLGTGAALERRYKVFARGLLASGWAIAYFTAYAAHALPPSRLIHSPTAGLLVLLVVAAAIIVHSLRYRSETATGLALGSAFLALQLDPGSLFGLGANVLLVGAGLLLAALHQWRVLPLAAMLLCYTTIALLPSPAGFREGVGLPVLWAFWVLFELYDLAVRGSALRGVGTLNGVAFLGMQLLAAHRAPETHFRAFLPLAAVALGVTTAVRWWQSPPAQDEPLRKGAISREGLSLTLFAAVLAAALLRRYDGIWSVLALLLEGEALVLLGWRFRQAWPRRLGMIVLGGAALRLATLTLNADATWITLAFGAALLVNLHLTREKVYAPAGGALLATALWLRLPSPLIAPAWALLGLLFLETGSRWPWLGGTGACLSLAACGRLFLSNFTISGHTGLLSHRLLTAGPFVPYFYYLWTAHRELRPRFARLCLWLPPVLLAALIRFEVGRTQTAVGLSLATLVFLAAGMRWRIVDVRWQSYLLGAAAFLRAWSTNFFIPGTVGGLPLRLVTAGLSIAALFAAHRMLPRDREDFTRWDRWARPAFALAGALLVAALLYNEVSGKLLTVAWSLESVLLVTAGFLWRERVLRLSGLALFFLCLLKVFFHDLASLDTLSRIFSFIVLGLLLLGVSWLYTRYREKIRRLL